MGVVARCPHCGHPILPGQRAVAAIAEGRLYHKPCAKRRDSVTAEKPGETGKYGFIKMPADVTPLRPGEPVFVIRATDPFAVKTVIDYARECERKGADAGHVQSAFDQAMRVAEWQRDNPELVKGLPD